MAEVLKNLEQYNLGRQTEWWEPATLLYTNFDGHGLDTHYLDRYRMKLVSQVGFAVDARDERAFGMAQSTAKRALVAHLYAEQLDIAHDLLHALHAGESRQKIIERVAKLLDSMTER